MNKVLKTLEEVRIEDWIWIIYLFLASFALIANFFEKDYLLNGNKVSKKAFKTINIAIFIIGAIRLRGQCLNQYAVAKMK